MKTIQIFGTEIEITTERRRRIIESVTETQEHLERELSYSEDLQHKDMIDFYRAHIEKLLGWLK